MATTRRGKKGVTADGSSLGSVDRSLTDEHGRALPKIKDIIRPIAHDVERYESQLAQHLLIASPLRNPYRNPRADHAAGIDVSHPSEETHKGSTVSKNMDNRLYAKSVEIRKAGSLSCLVSFLVFIISLIP